MIENVISTLIVIVAVLSFIALRVWLGFIIAKAARRRVAGFGGWIAASLIIGTLPTWLVYLFCIQADQLFSMISNSHAKLFTGNAVLGHYRICSKWIVLRYTVPEV
jgi:hypothetical protein